VRTGFPGGFLDIQAIEIIEIEPNPPKFLKPFPLI